MLLPVSRRRHHAAVPVRDRPRDSPMARPMTCPRRPRLILRPVFRPWCPSVLVSVFRRRHQAAYPVRDRPRDPSLVPIAVPSAAPTCSPSSAPTLVSFCAHFSFRRRHQVAYPVRDRPRDSPMARAWFQVLCPRRPRLVLRPVLRPWFPSVLLPVIPRKHQAAVPARDQPRDRPTARALFSMTCPRQPRLVLRPALRPLFPSVLLPVIPRQHQAAIPARDRPIARAWFRGLFPRRP